MATLDVKGLKCPLPVLKANKMLRGLEAGTVLEIDATDPGAVADFKVFCETTGHILVESTEADGVYSFKIRKDG
ncbi:MAG: sulfurtransferase TusA family protein [Alphaproteobacteria bacterium]